MRSLPDVLAYTYAGFASGFSKVGIQAHRFSLPLGWTTPATFDSREADQLLDEWTATAPESTWFPMLWMDGPDTKWWESVHPGECAVMRSRDSGEIVREAEGVPRPLESAGDNRGGKTLFDQHHQRSPCLHSFASTIWLEEACEALHRALDHFHRRHPGRFRAFYLCAGLSYEWFGWGNYSDQVLFDYSKPMEVWFKEWLQLRYGSLEALNTNWASEFRGWEEVAPPLPTHRPARDGAAFRSGPEHQAARDFDHAQADAQAHCLIRLCQAAKSTSPARFGAFYGYWWTQSNAPSPGRNGHLALQKILDSPEVDFLASPLDYVNRGTDGSSASQSLPDSALLHGKEFINSADIRLKKGAHPEWQPYVGSPESEAEGIEWMKKDFGFSMAHGLTHSWVDLFGGAFQDPVHSAALETLQKIAEAHSSRRQPANAEALLVIDEQGLDRTTPGHAAWTILLSANRQWHLSRCGFPWACVTLRDFLDYEWPTTRLVNFLVFDATSPGLVERIHEKLSTLQATAIWNFPDPSIRSLKTMERLTGFSLKQRASPPLDWEVQSAHDGLRFGPSHLRSGATARMRYFPEPSEWEALPCLSIKDPANGRIHAHWASDNEPCVAETNAPGFRSVLNTGLLLHETILARIAQEAGVHLYTPPGPVVHANPRFASVWTRDFDSSFTSPNGMLATSLWPEDSKEPRQSLPLQRRTCTLLALDPEDLSTAAKNN